ncbi:unnamed protein product [Ectocarpus sp. 6 AP-2014]
MHKLHKKYFLWPYCICRVAIIYYPKPPTPWVQAPTLCNRCKTKWTHSIFFFCVYPSGDYCRWCPRPQPTRVYFYPRTCTQNMMAPRLSSQHIIYSTNIPSIKKGLTP